MQKTLWVISLLFLVLWLYSALKPRVLPPEAYRYFSEDVLSRSLDRATRSYVCTGLSTLATFSALYLISRRSATGSILSELIGGRPTPCRAALLGLCLGAGAALLFSLVGLPFNIYLFHLDRAFNLTPMTLVAYLWDYAKNTLLSIGEYSLAGAAIAWTVTRFPGGWHFILGGAFLVASLTMYALYPVLVAPMFNSFHPLPEGQVMQDVRDLAASAGMEVNQVLVMEASAKTSRANAYFAGIGRTKQVVLYDTLLNSHSREEIRLVVAHELAHWRFGHIVKGILASSLGVLAALYAFRLAGAGADAGTSTSSMVAVERFLVAMFVFATLAGFVLSPVSSYVSRRFEVEADAYSLSLTGDSAAFVGSQVSLATTNLADVSLPSFIRWFAATHPSTLERILSANP